MTYFMNLLTRYCQLHILVGMVPERPLLLTAYAKAYHYTSGNTETNFMKIANYLRKFAEPLKTLQADCVEVSQRVGDTLMRFYQPLAKWAEAKTLTDAKVFAVLEEPKHMGIIVGEKVRVV